MIGVTDGNSNCGSTDSGMSTPNHEGGGLRPGGHKGRHRKRKRSNSMPIPQIKVTVDTPEDKKPEPIDDDILNDEEMKAAALHARGNSLGSGVHNKRRKKSIIGTGLEVTKLKHFKSFVESKILSKSDRALAAEAIRAGEQGANGPAAVTSTATSTSTSTGLTTAMAVKDSFMRRSSRRTARTSGDALVSAFSLTRLTVSRTSRRYSS